jgi:enoyl-[acyl-carrier-protein] reductase (NADH)
VTTRQNGYPIPLTYIKGRLLLVIHANGASGVPLKSGGTLFTMTYYRNQMVIPNYNVMGVAKAGLGAAMRYIAAELGPKGIRVHAISPGLWKRALLRVSPSSTS